MDTRRELVVVTERDPHRPLDNRLATTNAISEASHSLFGDNWMFSPLDFDKLNALAEKTGKGRYTVDLCCEKQGPQGGGGVNNQRGLEPCAPPDCDGRFLDLNGHNAFANVPFREALSWVLSLLIRTERARKNKGTAAFTIVVPQFRGTLWYALLSRYCAPNPTVYPRGSDLFTAKPDST